MTTLATSYYVTPGTLQDLISKPNDAGPREEQKLAMNKRKVKWCPSLRTKKGYFIKNTKCNRVTKEGLPLKDMEVAIVAQLKQLQLKKLEAVPVCRDHNAGDDDYLEHLASESSLLASLGRVYMERSKTNKQTADLIRSAALYNAAMARSARLADSSAIENLSGRKLDVEGELLSLLAGKRRRVLDNDVEKFHRSELDKIRRMCHRELQDINVNCSPHTAGGDQQWEKVQQSKRLRGVQRLYRDVNRKLKSVVCEMWKCCVQVLGKPPCRYALVAIGDFGRGVVTPYSDLEIAVLIEESADTCRNKRYFQKLLQYLLLKFVNLGETILPSVGIKSLNHVTNPENNWYIDLDTPRGVALHIPKPPVGAVSLDKALLIRTPSKMVKLLAETSGGKRHRLQSTDSLLTTEFIAGSEFLVRDYKYLVDDLLARPVNVNPSKSGVDRWCPIRSLFAGNILGRVCRSCTPTIGLGETIARFRNDLWMPDAIINALALLSGMSPGNPWSVIGEFRKRRQFLPQVIESLGYLIGVSAESRLRMSMLRFAKSQNESAEDMSIVTSESAMTTSYDSAHIFYELIFRFVDMATREKLLKLPDPTALSEVFKSDFFSASSQQMNINLNLRLGLHAEAEKDLQALAESDPEDHSSTTDLISVLLKTRSLRQISRVYSLMVQKHKVVLDSAPTEGTGRKSDEGDLKETSTDFMQAANILLQRSDNALQRKADPVDGEEALQRAVELNNLGVAWFEFGQPEKARLCFQQCFILWRNVHLADDGIHGDVADCLNKLGLCYSKTLDEENCVAHHRLALHMYLKIHHGDRAHPDIADTLVKLAHALGMARKFHQALVSQKAALQIYGVLWSDTAPHPDVAACLHGLGKTFYVLSQYDKAMQCHRRAVEMYTKLYGEDPMRREVAECFETLAEDFRVTGKLSEAIFYMDKARLIYENVYGTDIPNPRVAYCYDNLGAVYYATGNNAMAVNCYERSVAMNMTMGGDNYASLKMVETLKDLGNAWIALGDYGKSVDCHRRVCEMYDAIHGKAARNADKVAALSDLGAALELFGDFSRAIEYHRRALKMAEKLNAGEDTVSSSVAKCMAAYGGAWCLVGNAQKAALYLQKALDMFHEIYGAGSDHTNIASTLADLGNAYDMMGKYEEAVDYHNVALQMYRDIYGDDEPHPNIAMCMLNLGAAWSFLGNRQKTIECYSQALEQNRQLFGKGAHHPRIATCLTNLGQALCAAGRHEEGVPHLEEALSIGTSLRDAESESDGLSLIPALRNLGNATYDMKRYDKSVEYFGELLEIQRRVGGSDDNLSAIAETLKKLASSYRSLGDRQKATLYEKQEREISDRA